MTLDINNTFNSASWAVILKELEERDIATYHINIIDSYSEDREVIWNKGNDIRMEAGVPQASVLGPLLWNTLCDGVLRLNLPEQGR